MILIVNLYQPVYHHERAWT